MLGLVRHVGAKRQYIWEALNYFIYLSRMPKFLWNNKSPVSLKRLEWFCWFFACSYLHLVRCPLKLQNMLFWAGIVRHRISANQTVRCFWLKNLQNCLGYEVDFLFRLNLQMKHDHKILLANHSAGYFTFELLDMLIFIPGIHYYIILVMMGEDIKVLFSFSKYLFFVFLMNLSSKFVASPPAFA